MIGRTNAGGGGLKYASGVVNSLDSSRILTVTGLGFRPYAVMGYRALQTRESNAFICDADGNIVFRLYQGEPNSSSGACQVFDGGFSMEFPTYGSSGSWYWYAIGK